MEVEASAPSLIILFHYIIISTLQSVEKRYNRLAYMYLHLNGVGQPVSFAINW